MLHYYTIMVDDRGIPPSNNKPSLSRQKVGIVGQFIRSRRESLNLSQRSLGQLFQPPVTTQFISNVERGVTPLPPTHVATLASALQVPEEVLLEVLEKEYAQKLSDKLGKGAGGSSGDSGSQKSQVAVDPKDFAFIRSLYDAYKRSDDTNKKAFLTVCESLFKLPKSGHE